MFFFVVDSEVFSRFSFGFASVHFPTLTALVSDCCWSKLTSSSRKILCNNHYADLSLVLCGERVIVSGEKSRHIRSESGWTVSRVCVRTWGGSGRRGIAMKNSTRRSIDDSSSSRIRSIKFDWIDWTVEKGARDYRVILQDNSPLSSLGVGSIIGEAISSHWWSIVIDWRNHPGLEDGSNFITRG